MKLRKYEANDKVQVVELWKSVFADNAPHNDPERVIVEKLKIDDLIFVAEEHNQILGACIAGYDGHRGWLYSVAVHPSSQRGGIGSALVKHALSHLKTIGCQKTNIQIRSDNTAVASFYESLGFFTEDRLSMGAFLN